MLIFIYYCWLVRKSFEFFTVSWPKRLWKSNSTEGYRGTLVLISGKRRRCRMPKSRATLAPFEEASRAFRSPPLGAGASLGARMSWTSWRCLRISSRSRKAKGGHCEGFIAAETDRLIYPLYIFSVSITRKTARVDHAHMDPMP